MTLVVENWTAAQNVLGAKQSEIFLIQLYSKCQLNYSRC